MRGSAGVGIVTVAAMALVQIGTIAVADASDGTPPVVTVPANMTAEATSCDGAVVTFTVTANDETDGDVTASVVCVPASGSTFAIRTTTVNCSATDAASNVGSGSFTVTVQDTTAPPAIPVLTFPGTGRR